MSSTTDLPKRGWAPSPAESVIRHTSLPPDPVQSMIRKEPTRSRSLEAKSAWPGLFVVAANRMGYGPRPGQYAEFVSLGGTPDDRLAAYVEQQLFPVDSDDPLLLPRLQTAGFTTLDKSLTQLWGDHHENSPSWSYRNLPAVETELATFMRAVYSKWQLREVLVGFWHDHFNVYGWDYWSLPVWAHWDRTIRSHCFGNFRQFLEAVAKHPAMLYYLDNQDNTVAGPNENWARELCELMTMGAENYLGVRDWQTVPVDAQGYRVGYVDDDVYEVTRAFTGWSVADGRWQSGGNRPNTGEFYYAADDHDRFGKIVLGNFIDNDQPALEDGRDVLDFLAYHPGTARHIARKLCRRFISDDPPESIVEAAADVFHTHITHPGQIRRTLRLILNSDEFKQTWGEKTKRPFEIVASALRATNADLDFVVDGDDVSSFFWRYDACGQPLFGWHAPDGFPDLADKWQSTTPRVMTWRLILWLTEIEKGETGVPRLDVVGQTPASARSANALADFWTLRLLGRNMAAGDQQEVVDFMAQGFNPDLDLNLADEDTAERLATMVALILNSPYFLER